MVIVGSQHSRYHGYPLQYAMHFLKHRILHIHPASEHLRHCMDRKTGSLTSIASVLFFICCSLAVHLTPSDRPTQKNAIHCTLHAISIPISAVPSTQLSCRLLPWNLTSVSNMPAN